MAKELIIFAMCFLRRSHFRFAFFIFLIVVIHLENAHWNAFVSSLPYGDLLVSHILGLGTVPQVSTSHVAAACGGVQHLSS